MNYEEKKQNLITYIDDITDNNVMLAFSGGVDSSLLLKLCCDSALLKGTKVYAATIQTELHPMNDLKTAKRVAGESGAEHLILYLNELDEAGIRYNPEDRCYLCKKSLFQKLLARAEELQIKTVIEGTNEDDLHVYRPGIRALKELNIESPLARFGFTKAEVRRMAEEYGISVANRPSTPCMATRFPYGAELTYEKMQLVEKSEELLRNQGFRNVRVRVHDTIARIELDKDAMPKFLKMADEITAEMKRFGFDYITLDLEGFRSGSMDLHVNRSQK